MVYSLLYRRPSYVPASGRQSIEQPERGADSVKSGTSGMSYGIPPALSFDKIIAGGTCPPCTTRDFMNYLIYVEHAAENLQFYLWHLDYTERFNAIAASEQALSPEWTAAQAETVAQAAQAQTSAQKEIKSETVDILKGTDFAAGTKASVSEINSPTSLPHTPASQNDTGVPPGGDTTLKSTNRSDAAKKVGVDFENSDLKWQPFTIQPFREEISRIITTYVAEGSPRELNISARERNALLHALQHTTHPSSFRDVQTTIEASLRQQSHPNFIRWTICNGNRPRVIFARGLGVATILIGFVVAIVLTLSKVGRGYRALAAVGWFIGISTLIAAWKGMCVVLHGMHHRHLRPWELFTEEDDASSSVNSEMKKSFDTFGSSHGYEDEPWVAKYEKRNIIRKVFDREVWIQEPALRQIQDTIFIQSLIGAFILSAVCAAVFVALPQRRLYLS